MTPVNILTDTGKLNDNVPEAYRGLDRFEARKKVVADLVALGLVEKIEPNTMKVPYGDRSNVVIEPYLTDQWYVDAKTLAQPALEAVREGKTTFIPENWRKVYFDWLENIQPWCISRQLWWGHRIPVWYGRALDPEERRIKDFPFVLKEFCAELKNRLLHKPRSIMELRM